MKIGNYDLEMGAPSAARLVSLTGCSPAVMLDLLRSSVIASTVASAIMACVGEGDIERHELASAIAAEGVDKVREAVLDHYWRAVDPASYIEPEPVAVAPEARRGKAKS